MWRSDVLMSAVDANIALVSYVRSDHFTVAYFLRLSISNLAGRSFSAIVDKVFGRHRHCVTGGGTRNSWVKKPCKGD